MPSQSPRSEREEERRLNVRTLAIASAASASAALISSQLWFAGTWIAAAITPVLVALLAELLQRPTERIKALTSDRAALFPPAEDPAPRRSRSPEPDPSAPRPAPDQRAAPIRVYRSGAGAPSRGGRARGAPGRRKIAVGMVAATAAIAFVVAVLAITVPELITGQSIGQSERGSTFPGVRARDKEPASDEPREPQTQTETTTQTQTTTAPEDEQTTETTPPTETLPAPTTTPAPQAAPPPTTTPTEP